MTTSTWMTARTSAGSCTGPWTPPRWRVGSPCAQSQVRLPRLESFTETHAPENCPPASLFRPFTLSVVSQSFVLQGPPPSCLAFLVARGPWALVVASLVTSLSTPAPCQEAVAPVSPGRMPPGKSLWPTLDLPGKSLKGLLSVQRCCSLWARPLPAGHALGRGWPSRGRWDTGWGPQGPRARLRFSHRLQELGLIGGQSPTQLHTQLQQHSSREASDSNPGAHTWRRFMKHTQTTAVSCMRVTVLSTPGTAAVSGDGVGDRRGHRECELCGCA